MEAGTIHASARHCEALARRSGSTFFWAFRAVPREMFRDMCVLYAFMRHTDDLGDEPALPPAQRRSLLDDWSRQLDSALRGEPVENPLLPALGEMAERRGIPQELFQEVIRGVSADLVPRTFETFDELEHYCYQVAGAVGLCCLHVWGFRGELPHEASVACGTAFQLTNILRDLREDAQLGRCYLPQAELREFHCSPALLAEPRLLPELRPLMEFQVRRAKEFYARAAPLRDELLPDGRRIFAAFFDLYSSLLREIERRDYDVFSQRIRLSRWKKSRVLLDCWLGRERPVNVEVNRRP